MRFTFLNPAGAAAAPAARAVVAALLALCALGFSPGIAMAAPGAPDADGTNQSTGPQQTKTTSQLLFDLGADKASDRAYAAHALKAQLTRALSVVAHAKAGSLAGDEALSTLDELEMRLPEQCEAALQFPNTVAPAAEMLALLGVRNALPAVKDAASKERRRGILKRLNAAEATLQGVPAQATR